jgi:hypothetical protein
MPILASVVSKVEVISYFPSLRVSRISDFAVCITSTLF